jgi:hypothetical protein
MIANVVLPLASVLHVNIKANALMYKITRDMIELVSYYVTIKNSILSKPAHTISLAWITRKVRLPNNNFLSNTLRKRGSSQAEATMRRRRPWRSCWPTSTTWMTY